ncbi:hypothetical protein TRVA0_041S01376 [Trichomonascus vanleenenianus]|uniref:uncharacterized protein n=1 Tax=Trichomonascus vanleenenianus TaxID=2268995 RepID=UPI003ECA641E
MTKNAMEAEKLVTSRPVFNTRQMPAEIWMIVLEYLTERDLNPYFRYESIWRYRLVSREFNAILTPIIWRHVFLSIEWSGDCARFCSQTWNSYIAKHDEQGLPKLPEFRTLAEIVEDVFKSECRTVDDIMIRILKECLSRNRYGHIVAKIEKRGLLYYQIGKAWRGKKDKKTAIEIAKLIKSACRLPKQRRVKLNYWSLKHASPFLIRHVKDIRHVSITVEPGSSKIHRCCFDCYMDVVCQLAVLPRLQTVEFQWYKPTVARGSVENSVLKAFQERKYVKLKLGLKTRNGPAALNLLEKMKKYDDPSRTTTELRLSWLESEQLTPFTPIQCVPFESLRKATFWATVVPSNFLKVLLSFPNLGHLAIDISDVIYKDFDVVLQLPKNIKRLELSCRRHYLNLTGTIAGEGVKLLKIMAYQTMMQIALNMPSVECLHFEDGVERPVFSHFMKDMHTFGRLKTLHLGAPVTDQLISMLNHFKPSESLHFANTRSRDDDVEERKREGRTKNVKRMKRVKREEREEDDYEDIVAYGLKKNVANMANFWKCQWIPPRVVLQFSEASYSDLWYNIIGHFVALPNVSKLFVDFDRERGLEFVPRHFYGPYKLNDAWLDNLPNRFYFVGKQLAEECDANRPEIVAEYFN